MSKSKKVKLPTIEEKISSHVSKLLDAKTITPFMIYELMMDGYNAYKQGDGGTSSFFLWESILTPFNERERVYMNPYKLAILKNKEYPEEEDFDTLREA